MKLFINSLNLTEITCCIHAPIQSSLSSSSRIEYPCPICGKLFLQSVADRGNHVKRRHHLDLLDEKIEELAHDPNMKSLKDMAQKLGMKDFQLQQNVREYMKI